ncbi:MULTISPECIES: hypothetical protein [unclassified Wolbachia]|uniref:hypothetical protein n=1 Tax=unclassified Wolbachia TaxID=2640676 RepID=UPI002230D143|nr:hypothetical protein [Wolbachia endosymbiont (group A) of Apoderus coryli]
MLLSRHPSSLLFLSSQYPPLVIPVSRHWDLILLYDNVMKVASFSCHPALPSKTVSFQCPDTGIQKT